MKDYRQSPSTVEDIYMIYFLQWVVLQNLRNILRGIIFGFSEVLKTLMYISHKNQ